LVVAIEGATFGIPEVKRGLMAGAGALIRLPKRIPTAIALELALTGEAISAQRAYDIGLINRVVPVARLMNEALALAEVIADNAPLAVRASKRVMKVAGELPDAQGWEVNNAAFPEVFGSKDAMEGSVAFAEKRAPNWTGA
jgi:enoyl-CoA hydratase/carnithine racemase